MEVGVVGKPNVGKSTFFSAATLAPAQIASYPFTTIESNRGIAYVRAKCPHTELGIDCNPRNAPCKNGIRLVPVEMLDVAGLVPDAHSGRGLGNKFLDDLRQARALIHIVDASGGTDFEGNVVGVGEHDPVEDVKFLEVEIIHWVTEIMGRGWDRIARQVELEGLKVERALQERLTGLGVTEGMVHNALRKANLSKRPRDWSKEDLFHLAAKIRAESKPMIIAANKCDVAPEENIRRLKGLDGYTVVPTCAESELALRRAAKANLVSYDPGASSFEILEASKLSPDQSKALTFIESYLRKFGNTGVQNCLEEAIFRLLDLIVVFPVEDENKWTDKDGNVLPDAYLMPRGSSARDLAYKIHTDLGDNFIRAINARTKVVIGQDYELQNGDVITIVART